MMLLLYIIGYYYGERFRRPFYPVEVTVTVTYWHTGIYVFALDKLTSLKRKQSL